MRSHYPHLRPCEVIARLEQEIEDLEALVDLLKGALASQGMEKTPCPPRWATLFSPQQRAMLGALYEAYPQCLTREALLELLPSSDHALERSVNQVSVLLTRMKALLGEPAAERVRGAGFRLTSKMCAVLSGEA